MQRFVKKRKQYLALKEETKIQVGFPGRKQQIGLEAAKKILKKCDLTIVNGYDAQIFCMEMRVCIG